ncbi:MAG TPA: isochorismatase family cysteine hydrolase [Acidimicrobiales bacterium]
MTDHLQTTLDPSDLDDIIDPARCALLVIDMQNDYLHDDGAFARMGADVSRLQPVVPHVNRAIDLARAADVPRIFVRQTHGKWFNTRGWIARGRAATKLPVDRIPLVEHGSWGAEFYGVEPGDDELVITKHRYSAFIYTELEATLHAIGRDTAVLTGATTDICVRYTAVDALMRGFHPILVSEATTAGSEELQAQVEKEFREHIGNVVGIDDVAKAWKAGA